MSAGVKITQQILRDTRKITDLKRKNIVYYLMHRTITRINTSSYN